MNARTAVVLLFTFVLSLGIFSVHDVSTWRHIRIGEQILSQGVLPHVDALSYTVSGRPWTADCWLADVLLYCAHTQVGPQGVIALKAGVLAFAFILLLSFNAAAALTAVIVAALGACASWRGFSETPAIFNFIFLALFLRALHPRGSVHWTLVLGIGLLECVWANLQGSVALLGVWIVGLKIVKEFLGAPTLDRRYGSLAAAVLVGFLINPYGLSLLGHAAGGGHWAAFSISYILFAAAGLGAIWTCIQEEFFLSAVAATLLALSLLLAELRPLYIFAACPIIGLALQRIFLPRPEDWRRTAVCIVALAGLFLLHKNFIYMPRGLAHGYGTGTFEEVARYINDKRPLGRMFNEPEIGDALLGLTHQRVFIDGREGLYTNSFLHDANSWSTRWNMLDQVYDFNYAVITNHRASSASHVIDSNPAWGLAYADDDALLYVKKSGLNAKLLEDSPADLGPQNLWPDSINVEQPGLLIKLDRWAAQAPLSLTPILEKAYVLSRLGLSDAADPLLDKVKTSARLRWDPELNAILACVLQAQGQEKSARFYYVRAASRALSLGDRQLETAVLTRLQFLGHKADAKAD